MSKKLISSTDHEDLTEKTKFSELEINFLTWDEKKNWKTKRKQEILEIQKSSWEFVRFLQSATQQNVLSRVRRGKRAKKKIRTMNSSWSGLVKNKKGVVGELHRFAGKVLKLMRHIGDERVVGKPESRERAVAVTWIFGSWMLHQAWTRGVKKARRKRRSVWYKKAGFDIHLGQEESRGGWGRTIRPRLGAFSPPLIAAITVIIDLLRVWTTGRQKLDLFFLFANDQRVCDCVARCLVAERTYATLGNTVASVKSAQSLSVREWVCVSDDYECKRDGRLSRIQRHGENTSRDLAGWAKFSSEQ